MANRFVKCYSGQVHPVALAFPAKSTGAYDKDDLVTIASGAVERVDAATERILGTVAGVVSTSGAPKALPVSSAAATDKVLVNVDPTQIIEMTLDAAMGTTAGSDKVGATFDLVDHDTVDESTVGGDQVMLIEIVSTTVGRFVILNHPFVYVTPDA